MLKYLKGYGLDRWEAEGSAHKPRGLPLPPHPVTAVHQPHDAHFIPDTTNTHNCFSPSPFVLVLQFWPLTLLPCFWPLYLFWIESVSKGAPFPSSLPSPLFLGRPDTEPTSEHHFGWPQLSLTLTFHMLRSLFLP